MKFKMGKLTRKEYLRIQKENREKEAKMSPKELAALSAARKRHARKVRDEILTSYELNKQKEKRNKGVSALIGIAVGDAIGVPFEFISREQMSSNLAVDMIGYGTHKQPLGTWSDDSSLSFCLAESLILDYNLSDIAKKFVDWKYSSYWTARNEVFDIGNTTSIAISRLNKILTSKEYKELEVQKYAGNEFENGNGSLMRILPLLFHIRGLDINQQFKIIWDVSALTHRHIRAAMSCLIYLKLAEYLLDDKDKKSCYFKMRGCITDFWSNMQFSMNEQKHFKRLIQNDIQNLKYTDLKSSGYVIDSLESSIWCFLKTNDYKESVITAVNLGNDTDTIAAITGGICGLYYGIGRIPEKWISNLARKDDIIALGKELGGIMK